jgi:FAD-dependent urate hydroxylase
VAERIDVAIIGAGPFGLSTSAHLRHLSVRTFGAPMNTWRTQMRREMILRSAWEETSLSAPDDLGTIDAWAEAANEPRVEPLPLTTFLRYADWFREKFVPEGDPSEVASVERAGTGYRIVTAAGDEADARHVVVAVGAMPFVHVPPVLADVVGAEIASKNGSGADRWHGNRVAVVGGGQHALESAGLAAQVAAEVELIARSRVHWFADREPETPRGPVRRSLYRLAYPALGYGPPPLNRVVLSPDLFAALPSALREWVTRRTMRAGGSPSLRPLIEGKVKLTEQTTVVRAERSGGLVRLELSDGSSREVDDLVVAAGYRFTLDRLPFLSHEIRASVDVDREWPVLDRWFRSSDRGLFFVGYAAEDRFGPLSRFVLGVKFAAQRVRQALD